jgi:hypothetical protein
MKDQKRDAKGRFLKLYPGEEDFLKMLDDKHALMEHREEYFKKALDANNYTIINLQKDISMLKSNCWDYAASVELEKRKGKRAVIFWASMAFIAGSMLFMFIQNSSK